MTVRRVVAVSVVLAVVVLLRVVALSHQGVTAPPVRDVGAVASPAVPPDAFHAQVVRVVDGDTFVARIAGSGTALRVRVIGADTPETVKPGVPVRCYGPQASTFTKHLLPPGTEVLAAHEPGGDTDRYGRQLWDVWLPDGRFLESVLVATGAARAYPISPQVEHASLLAALQQSARDDHRGLWAPPCNGDSFGSRSRSGGE